MKINMIVSDGASKTNQARSTLQQLETWFRQNLIKGVNITSQQKIAAGLGWLIGALSSVVNFPLGFAFGKNLAQELHLSAAGTEALAWYLGITAIIPLFFLAARTSAQVLRLLVQPKSKDYILIKKNQLTSVFIHTFRWGLSILSALPFTYVTASYLQNKLGLAALPFIMSAFIAPILVNSWVLQSLGKEIQHSMLTAIKYRQRREDKLRSQLTKHLIAVLQTIEQSQVRYIHDYYQAFFSQQPKDRCLSFLMQLTPRYNIHPLPKLIFISLGTIIGACSAYQYLDNGKAAADWLQLPILENWIGFSALFCNAALGAYTSRIVFAELYDSVTQLFRYIKMKEITLVFSSAELVQSLFSKLKMVTILWVAASAATPNFYLALAQQQNHFTFIDYWLLLCSFLGPLAINFYAIHKALNTQPKREQLKQAVDLLLTKLDQLKIAYLIALQRLIY